MLSFKRMICIPLFITKWGLILMKINIDDRSYNYQMEVNDRKMITSSTALGILRHQLARNIGTARIKGFLIRLGWEMGEMMLNKH
jgi:hypothetical protein